MVNFTVKKESLFSGRWDFYLVVQLSEATVKVDQKGRVVIPSKIRKQLNIKNIVKISVKGGEIALKPVEDPLSSLEKLVVKGTTDVERDIQRLRRAAERELQREA
jgi:AbrB family looped-hinge helix DNA binding protein